jgi:hypothetical protein
MYKCYIRSQRSKPTTCVSLLIPVSVYQVLYPNTRCYSKIGGGNRATNQYIPGDMSGYQVLSDGLGILIHRTNLAVRRVAPVLNF